MAWEDNDIISVVFKQELFGEEVLNKLFYRIINKVGAVAIRLALDFLINEIIDAMVLSQTDDLSHLTQQAVNLTDLVNFEDFGEFAVGAIADTTPLPSYAAVGMKKTVGTRLTRPGSIRIAGIPSISTVDNDLTSGAIAAFETMGNTLEATVSYISGTGEFMDFEPVVVHRLPDGSLDLTKINLVTAVSGARLTSQVSRRKNA